MELYVVVVCEGWWYLLVWDWDVDDWCIFCFDWMWLCVLIGLIFVFWLLFVVDVQIYFVVRVKGLSIEDCWLCMGEVVIEFLVCEVKLWVEDGELEEFVDGFCCVWLGLWLWMGIFVVVVWFDVLFMIVGLEQFKEVVGVLVECFIVVMGFFF